MAGTLDGPTRLQMDRQICVDSKGDYYCLPEIEIVDQSSLKSLAEQKLLLLD